MLIYPAIDLRGGQVVRLHQGDYAQETRYPLDPLALAKNYRAAGAEWLHVVDLDGARAGAESHRSLIARIATESGFKVQSGGGVRSRADFEALRKGGVQRVVVGSLFVRQPEVIARWIAETSSEQVCIALDVRAGEGDWWVQAAGWREASNLSLWSALAQALHMGAQHFLITDIGRDGTLTGPNVALYREIGQRFPSARVQASGGVSSLADLTELRAIGVGGCIIGKALLEGRFTLVEALQESPTC